MAKILALVPARAGSRGIPHKNLAEICGRPLIAYTLEAAAASACLDRTIVSTDSPEIALAARRLGAEAPFLRPRELATDHTPTLPVLRHALDWLDEHQAYRPDVLVLLQPTSPLRAARDIDQAVALLFERDADSVVSVSEARTHPALTRIIRDDGTLAPYRSDLHPPGRRQDDATVYQLNGAIYAMRPDLLARRGTWYTDRTLAYVMPWSRALDVDEPFDLDILTALLSRQGAAHARAG
jgi:CMP-N-acetylneuraminic acid synthetase